MQAAGRKRVAVIAGALVLGMAALVALVVAVNPAFAPSAVSAKADQAARKIGECVDKSGAMSSPNPDDVRIAAGDCADPIFEELAAELGPGTAREIMFAAMDLEPRFADCHVPSHSIAHGASLTTPDNELMLHAYPECAYGYLDGVAMALGEKYATLTDAEMAALLYNVCNTYPKDREDEAAMVGNCYHGFGHVLWSRHKNDASATLKGCELLNPDRREGLPSAPAQCVGGAAMNVAEAMKIGEKVTPLRESPSAYCLELTGDLVRECLIFTANEDIVMRGNDPSAYLDWCESVGLSDTLRKTCLGAIVAWGSRAGRLGGTLGLCYEYSRDEEGNRACLSSAYYSLQESAGLTPEEAVEKTCSEFAQGCKLLTEMVAGRELK